METVTEGRLHGNGKSMRSRVSKMGIDTDEERGRKNPRCWPDSVWRKTFAFVRNKVDSNELNRLLKDKSWLKFNFSRPCFGAQEMVGTSGYDWWKMSPREEKYLAASVGRWIWHPRYWKLLKGLFATGQTVSWGQTIYWWLINKVLVTGILVWPSW